MEKPSERAWQTLLRTEVVCLQGVGYVILRTLFAIVMIPALVCVAYYNLLKGGFKERPWWIALLMLFPWLVVAALDSFSVPLVVLYCGIRDIFDVARGEWAMAETSAFGDGAPPHDYLADVINDYMKPINDAEG